MPRHAGHELASRLEADLHEALGGGALVFTHLEPLEDDPGGEAHAAFQMGQWHRGAISSDQPGPVPGAAPSP